MSHYLLEKGALGNKPSPFTAFYYPSTCSTTPT